MRQFPCSSDAPAAGVAPSRACSDRRRVRESARARVRADALRSPVLQRTRTIIIAATLMLLLIQFNVTHSIIVVINNIIISTNISIAIIIWYHCYYCLR